jgi:transcriptional regulator with XRE-family HTH domain
MAPIVVRLGEVREKAELSQGELARRARTSQATVSNLELGKGRVVHLDIIERLADVLGVKPLGLLAETGAKPKRRRKNT